MAPPRARCMTPRCPRVAVQGRARCSKHGPASAKSPMDRVHYDYGHQQRRARRIAAGETCAYAYLGDCHGPLHLDHIVPISLGGWSGDDNEQLMCEYHNISKGGRNRIKKS
jgi:5-methylcytosine-specific restriction endonuclease McrA